MMMMPRRNHEFDLLGEMFRDPFFTEGESKVMKTDIKEKKDKYLIDIDLPGYEKDNIKFKYLKWSILLLLRRCFNKLRLSSFLT